MNRILYIASYFYAYIKLTL